MIRERNNAIRTRLVVQGAVQGVGFRPFIYRLARSLNLKGFVLNSNQGVVIEVEGLPPEVDQFYHKLLTEAPPFARITHTERTALEPAGYNDFTIELSSSQEEPTALILPDIATCSHCLNEIFDPSDRRYHYPFTNCTSCGPRYTIILNLPYDRPNTTMRDFPMCVDCRQEYENPFDRRFHAQPIACPQCGPHVFLTNPKGEELSRDYQALLDTAEALKRGKIVAVKGIGGFHLMVDATNTASVKRLRERKRREAKPLALMTPDLFWAEKLCQITDREREVLTSPQAPIVLMFKTAHSDQLISPEVAPDNPFLGLMLPYSPLHHLLLSAFGGPVVATSGNLSDEPIATENEEALRRLGAIADLFLLHNRPIARYVDDSVVRVIQGKVQILRRARGYAPLPFLLERELPPILALGGHLKNTISFSHRDALITSPHIGDLETLQAWEGFQRTLSDLPRFWHFNPQIIACDLHPDYQTTRQAEVWAKGGESGRELPCVRVQHHWAHALSCLLDNQLLRESNGRSHSDRYPFAHLPPFLAISWDGTGYGSDGSVWGGEGLILETRGFKRVCHLKPFPLPGGDGAVRKAYRCALALLSELFPLDTILHNPKRFSFIEEIKPEELDLLTIELKHRLHTPITTSAGRLFDAVSALLGVRYYSRFEGEAAMALEFAAYPVVDTPLRFNDERTTSPSEKNQTDRILLTLEHYSQLPKILPPLQVKLNSPINEQSHASLSPYIWDWSELIIRIAELLEEGTSLPDLSWAFHWALAEGILQLARKTGSKEVLLTGGCFQNRLLTEMSLYLLAQHQINAYIHQNIPPGDGGISVGQVLAAWLITQNIPPNSTP